MNLRASSGACPARRTYNELSAVSVKVKFCGITRPEDATMAAALGADAIGFVFYEKSPRYIEPAAAAEIISRLPPFVCKVGLFVNSEKERVERIVSETGIDLVQYHGDESPAKCESGPKPWMKAIRVHRETNIEAEAARFGGASAIFLDAYDDAAYGGTGRSFDWGVIPRDMPRPVILAGGLTPQNVGEAIRIAAPYAVDVSGGIESYEGIKDPAKMKKFLAEARSIEC
jgi:phosphoribosylanthranilate isomerase